MTQMYQHITYNYMSFLVHPALLTMHHVFTLSQVNEIDPTGNDAIDFKEFMLFIV